MKIIAKTLILLGAALGLPFVTDGLWDAKQDEIEMPRATERDFCRLTFDQIANGVYRCEPVSAQVATSHD